MFGTKIEEVCSKEKKFGTKIKEDCSKEKKFGTKIEEVCTKEKKFGTKSGKHTTNLIKLQSICHQSLNQFDDTFDF